MKNRGGDGRQFWRALGGSRSGLRVGGFSHGPMVARPGLGDQGSLRHPSYDAYPHFKAIHEGRSDHGKGATQLARCTAMILELSLVGFLSPLARKFDIYP